MSNKLVVLKADGSMIYDLEGNYIGNTSYPEKLKEYVEPKTQAEITLELIKAGVAPKDIIELKRNDLV